MENSFSNYRVPKELLKFHMEGLYSTNPSMTQFEYFRVTYQPSKSRIPVAELVKKFKIFAEANIPITRTESIDMSLKISKDGNEYYAMQYRDNSKELRIRCDTEHGKPHVDIEWPGHPQDKSWLKKEPKNYDEAIDLILTKAEENNPRIGAMYWIMPPLLLSNDEKVEMLYQLRNLYGIETPLTVVARVASAKMLNEATRRKDDVMDDQDSLKLFESLCKDIAEQEQKEGSPLHVNEISYKEGIVVFPFQMIHPPGSELILEDYPRTNKNLKDKLIGLHFKG